jgi:CubicO group peptidase (beta-lactamase class C family)
VTVKTSLGIGIFVAMMGVSAYASFFFVRGLSNGSGFVAKHLCSLIHVSGLEPDRAQAMYIDPWIARAGAILDIEPLADGVEVRALWARGRAEFRGGLGCVLDTGGAPLPAVDLPEGSESALPVATPADLQESFEVERLRAAIDEAFQPAVRNTLAVLILHDGRIVAERYAEGVDHSTRLPGWSMAKSVTATLLGILDGDGRVDLDAPGAIREWRGTDDPRANITLDHLIRMTSGLDITEREGLMDPNSTMLYGQADAARYAAERRLQADPGEHWEYMSGNTVLVSRAISEVLGGSLESTLNFVHDRLFAPLGIATAVIEPDPVGTLVGSTFMLATAREWAKLGQLYVNDGMWNGTRILPVHWRDYVTRHTQASGSRGYGAGFWLTSRPDVPADAFFMQGFQGQAVMIIPSERLVLVRLGASPVGIGLVRLTAEVVASLRN